MNQIKTAQSCVFRENVFLCQIEVWKRKACYFLHVVWHPQLFSFCHSPHAISYVSYNKSFPEVFLDDGKEGKNLLRFKNIIILHRQSCLINNTICNKEKKKNILHHISAIVHDKSLHRGKHFSSSNWNLLIELFSLGRCSNMEFCNIWDIGGRNSKGRMGVESKMDLIFWKLRFSDLKASLKFSTKLWSVRQLLVN